MTAASSDLNIDSLIRDNAGGASGLTVSGSRIVALSNANTYTGPTTVSGGKLRFGRTTNTGSLFPSSALIDNGEIEFNRLNTVIQGIGFRQRH